LVHGLEIMAKKMDVYNMSRCVVHTCVLSNVGDHGGSQCWNCEISVK